MAEEIDELIFFAEMKKGLPVKNWHAKLFVVRFKLIELLRIRFLLILRIYSVIPPLFIEIFKLKIRIVVAPAK
jgi:hypothetical protein